ncbi:MAG: Sodium:alanine symporter family protein, partial [Candidatus Kentron sp. G]
HSTLQLRATMSAIRHPCLIVGRCPSNFEGRNSMATKFFTCTLAIMYRKEDEDGIPQGGPMYYIEVGLGKRFKPLAVAFSIFGLIGFLPLFQSNQLAEGEFYCEKADIGRYFRGLVNYFSLNSSLRGICRMLVSPPGRTASFSFVDAVRPDGLTSILQGTPRCVFSIVLSKIFWIRNSSPTNS